MTLAAVVTAIARTVNVAEHIKPTRDVLLPSGSLRVNEQCLEWKGKLDKDGYGKGRPHRWAYQLFHGRIPYSMFVLHRCDNRACINPLHLYLGDARQNAKDAVARKRHGNSRKTHCKQGHPYSEGNTKVVTTKNGKQWRRCLKCLRQWDADYKKEKA